MTNDEARTNYEARMTNRVWRVCFLAGDFRLVIHSFGLSRFLRRYNAAIWVPSKARVLAASALAPPEQLGEENHRRYPAFELRTSSFLRYSSFAIRHSPFVIDQHSFVICHSGFVIDQHSFVIPHSSFTQAYLWHSGRNQQCCAP
jgi:hypothetical protein